MNLSLQTTALAFIAIAIVACGKREEKKADATSLPIVQTKAYGKEDAECYAGIVRAFDAKHLTQADFHNWKEKLGSKDKDWLNGFADFFSNAGKVVNANLGKSPKQLYESKLITINQLNVIESYVTAYDEADALKASSVSAEGCVKVGFSKGADTN